MKNTILKFSLTALAALTLAACGSSGGGDAGSSSQAPTKDKQTAQATQTTKNKNNVSDSASPSLNNKTGGVIVIDSDNKGNVTTKTVALTSANLYKINVDGKDIPIGFGPGISARGWTVASAQTINGMKLNGKLEVCCGSYSNVRFGAIESQDPSQDDILFLTDILQLQCHHQA